jgi:hypothetical protein
LLLQGESFALMDNLVDLIVGKSAKGNCTKFCRVTNFENPPKSVRSSFTPLLSFAT